MQAFGNNTLVSSSYLSKGMVEKLEVVNKKWVRVRLAPGNQVEGGVRQMFELFEINFRANLSADNPLVQHWKCGLV